jgi:hypothetical protein
VSAELTTLLAGAKFILDVSALAFFIKRDSVVPGHKAMTRIFVSNNSPVRASEKLNTKALDAP